MNNDISDNQFAVLLDGDVTVTSHLRAQMTGRTVIAADGGIRHAALFGVVPALWVGDFDSTSNGLLSAYADVPRETHPPAKAISDGELSINHALEMGATDILVLGASGGARTDHVLFNLLGLMAMAGNTEAHIWACSGVEAFYPIAPSSAFEPGFSQGAIFSIIGVGMAGLTIKGAQWPLDKVTPTLGSTLTLSNTVQGRLSITLSSGYGLVIVQL